LPGSSASPIPGLPAGRDGAPCRHRRTGLRRIILFPAISREIPTNWAASKRRMCGTVTTFLCDLRTLAPQRQVLRSEEAGKWPAQTGILFFANRASRVNFAHLRAEERDCAGRQASHAGRLGCSAGLSQRNGLAGPPAWMASAHAAIAARERAGSAAFQRVSQRIIHGS